MTILVLGSSGMLGQDVVALLRSQGHTVLAPTEAELDLRQPPAKDYSAGCDWVVNCAAYTAVDKAETERDAATVLNEAAPALLADNLTLSARFIHISTDYVFDGTKEGPYVETDPVCPVSVYGKSKAAGEKAVMALRPDSVILRTSWLYGQHGHCFPKAILARWQRGETIRVVNDQIGCPTYTCELARAILSVIEKQPEGGIYHCTGPEAMSWYQFALEILREQEKLHPTDLDINVTPISTADWPTPAVRPKNSVLDCSKLAQATGFVAEPVGISLIRFCEPI